MKKRILHCGLTWNRGGIESVTLKILSKINRDLYAFDFLVFGDSVAYEQDFLNLGSRIFKLENTHNPIKRWWTLHKFYKKHYSEFYAVHCSFCSLYSISLIILARLSGIKKIILHSRQANYVKRNFFNLFRHELHKRIVNLFVTDYVACSKPAASFMFTRSICQNKCKILYNPVDFEKYFYSEEIRNNIRKKMGIQTRFVVGHIGVFLPFKNHKFLLDVFESIKKREKNAVLLLIGDGNGKKSIRDIIQKKQIEDDVVFTGNVPSVQPYLSAMDVFVFPSLNEGFPNVVIEAQSSGLCCFLSDQITREVRLLPDYVTFLKLENPELWAKCILEGKRPVNRKVNRNLFQYLNIDSIVGQYQNLYEDIS